MLFIFCLQVIATLVLQIFLIVDYFEQYQTFLSNVFCGAETALTECWHRQVDCKTLFFAQPGDLSEIIGTIQFHQILGLA